MENYHHYQGAGASMNTVQLKQQQAVEREAAEWSLDEWRITIATKELGPVCTLYY